MSIKERLELLKQKIRALSPTQLLLLFVLAIGAGMAIVLMLLRESQETKVPTGLEPIPTPILQPTPTPSVPKAYFMNKVITLSPVTGYSWEGNNLLYSTPEGIYQAGTNTSFVKTPIQDISWGINGQALYRSAANWFLFQPATGHASKVEFSGSNPQLSPDGQRAAAVNGALLEITNLATGVKTSREIGGNITAIRWSADASHLALSQKTATGVTIHIFTPELDSKEFIPLEGEFNLLAFSPEATALLLSKPGELRLLSLAQGTTLFKFDETSEVVAAWADQNNILVIETRSDALGRKIDYIYRIGSDGNREYLGNSMPIPRKVDTTIPLNPNPLQTALPLVEKKSTLWLIALIPDLLPSYTEPGLTFFPISKAAPEH